MAAETGNTYISGTITDTGSVEIPTVYPPLSTLKNSIKSIAKWLRNDRQPKVTRLAPKRLHCHFLLSIVVAIARNSFLSSLRSKPHFVVGVLILAVVAPEICISGFGDLIAISDCRPMLQSLADIFFELSMVVNLRYSVGISMMSLTDSEIYVFPVSAFISGCRSLLESLNDLEWSNQCEI